MLRTADNHTPFIPSVEEVRAYCESKGYRISPERFMDYYTANGWRLGKSEMKDWKAVVRNWERQEAKQTENVSGYCRQESGKGVKGYGRCEGADAGSENTTVPSCEERMALYNSRRGDLTGYDCPICHNKGFVFLMKDGYEYTMECECMEKRRGKWRLQKAACRIWRSGIASRPTRRNELAEIHPCGGGVLLRGKGGLVYIGGQVGAGKTHICTAIANRLMLQGKGCAT